MENSIDLLVIEISTDKQKVFVFECQLYDTTHVIAAVVNDIIKSGELQRHDDVYIKFAEFGNDIMSVAWSVAAYYVGCVSGV